MAFYKNRGRMLKHRAIKRAVAGKKYNKRHLRMPVSNAVKTYVKRTIHQNIENKQIQVNSGQSFGSVAESPDFNVYPMCPLALFWTISQGVGQGARVGNSIKIRKVMLNYIIRPTAYDAVFNPNTVPNDVQLMLGYVKNSPSLLPVAADISQLFQAGSSVSAPIGTLRDVISVINTDYWVIKKRWTHKVGYANNGGTGTLPAFQSFANNDYKYNIIKKMDITSLCPATCSFNDAGSSTQSKNLFFMYYAVAANGSAYAANTLPVNIEYWIDFKYEDA